MNLVVTSKEEIMRVCRKIVSERGISALNMRVVAKECGIALGTLYNYYSDKDDLLIATIESVWKNIFGMYHGCENNMSFADFVADIFYRMREGLKEYPNFFMAHSISIANSQKAKAIMENCFGHIRSALSECLKSDVNVKENAFSDTFTQSDFTKFVLNNIILLFAQGKTDCSALVEIIRRTIY